MRESDRQCLCKEEAPSADVEAENGRDNQGCCYVYRARTREGWRQHCDGSSIPCGQEHGRSDTCSWYLPGVIAVALPSI